MRICSPRRNGLSLVELLLASAALAIIAGALGSLAATIHASNDYCQEQGLGLAHARSAWLRITSSVEHAHASEAFPGCLVVSQSRSGYSFPDTLVVWKPSTTAVDPAGLPRVNELIIYTPNPQAPNELWKISHATDTTVVPAVADTSGWQTLSTTLRTSATATRLVITDRLRTATINSVLQSCVRFRVAATPSNADWAAYKAGTVTFDSLAWPLDMHGKQAGLRNVASFVELQVSPDHTKTSAEVAQPFFGAASLRYALKP